MKIVYLDSTVDDLIWMRRYYESIFPQGHQKARQQFKLIQDLIAQNPFIGHKTHKENVREFSIPKTPFSVIYQVLDNRIEILRIWDERRNR